MKATYLNLPIRSKSKTEEFLKAIGLEINPSYTSEDTTNAKINQNTFLMLLEDARFESFMSAKPPAINHNSILAIQFDTISDVDAFYGKAINAGAVDETKSNPEGEAFMYGKAFRDINGHLWELFAFISEPSGQ